MFYNLELGLPNYGLWTNLIRLAGSGFDSVFNSGEKYMIHTFTNSFFFLNFDDHFFYFLINLSINLEFSSRTALKYR